MTLNAPVSTLSPGTAQPVRALCSLAAVPKGSRAWVGAPCVGQGCPGVLLQPWPRLRRGSLPGLCFLQPRCWQSSPALPRGWRRSDALSQPGARGVSASASSRALPGAVQRFRGLSAGVCSSRVGGGQGWASGSVPAASVPTGSQLCFGRDVQRAPASCALGEAWAEPERAARLGGCCGDRGSAGWEQRGRGSAGLCEAANPRLLRPSTGSAH